MIIIIQLTKYPMAEVCRPETIRCVFIFHRSKIRCTPSGSYRHILQSSFSRRAASTLSQMHLPRHQQQHRSFQPLRRHRPRPRQQICESERRSRRRTTNSGACRQRTKRQRTKHLSTSGSRTTTRGRFDPFRRETTQRVRSESRNMNFRVIRLIF